MFEATGLSLNPKPLVIPPYSNTCHNRSSEFCEPIMKTFAGTCIVMENDCTGWVAVKELNS